MKIDICKCGHRRLEHLPPVEDTMSLTKRWTTPCRHLEGLKMCECKQFEFSHEIEAEDTNVKKS